MNIRYGPSGLPPGEPEEAIAALRERGYDACEISFARRYPAKDWLSRLGAAAEEADVLLSVHGPLFAFPGNTDVAKRKQAASNIDHSAGLAALLDADVIVIHPGFLLGRTHEQAVADVVEHLGEIEQKLQAKGRLRPFGIEVMGRVRDFGSVDDVVAVARAVDWIRPVIDFAHFQATSDGSLREAADFAAVLEQAGTVVKEDERLHLHVSDIRYANRNEDRHVPYGEGSLSLEPLADALAAYGRPVTVISESPDEASHESIGRLLGKIV